MTFQLPEFRHDDGKVLVYTDAYVSHRSQPRKAKSVYSLSLDEAGILFNGLKTVLQEHYETPEWAVKTDGYWDIQEYKIWKGIDKDRPCWASRGFACSEWKDAYGLMQYIEQNTPAVVLRVVPHVDSIYGDGS